MVRDTENDARMSEVTRPESTEVSVVHEPTRIYHPDGLVLNHKKGDLILTKRIRSKTHSSFISVFSFTTRGLGVDRPSVVGPSDSETRGSELEDPSLVTISVLSGRNLRNRTSRNKEGPGSQV